jgi:hypothetical protein
MKTKLVDMGYAVARIQVPENDREMVQMQILSGSLCDENGYYPAESVTVYGVKGLFALRDALNEAFPLEETARTE